ncbi:MAG: hypothetical protein M3R01_09405 [Actinomycetota bacterium]|nr:hypothetical protein [Actinomycetota bacterium]
MPVGSSPRYSAAEGDSEQTWIELRAGEGAAAIVLSVEDDNAVSPSDHHPSVYVGDPDDHLARAETAGATTVSPITHPGFRS